MSRDFNRACALRLAEAGVPVFPCGDDKKPKVKWREASSSDPQTLASMWAQHPNALPGIDLAKAGLVVLDGDRHGGPDGVANLHALLKEHSFDPHKCPIIKTPNDGIHIYFRQNGTALTNSRGSLPDGVDIRGEGGYVIAPFAILPDGRSYEPVSTAPNLITAVADGNIPHAPEWLAELVKRPEREERSSANSQPFGFSTSSGVREEAFARAALDNIAREVAAAPKGKRNERLYAGAFRLATMIARGWLAQAEVHLRLLAAAHANGFIKEEGQLAAEKTIRSGLEGGLECPHDDLGDRENGTAHKAEEPAAERNEAPVESPVEIEPIDLWAKFEPPPLPNGLLPPVIERFARVQGEMMGADPGGLAAAALAVCAAAIPDRIKLQVKVHDPSWQESARLWVAPIGDPSTKKSPLIAQAVKPLARIDARLYRDFCRQVAEYNALSKDEQKGRQPPKQVRLRIEDTTIEAAQEVLKDSPNGVLCLQDELSGWFGGMDKYSGNRGAAKDRGFWLQSYNGGPSAINRVSRGPGLIENLSICVLGGIQPEPMRKLAADSVDDGLLQRLVPIVLRPATLGRDESRPDAVADYEATVEALVEIKAPGLLPDLMAPILRLDDGAQRIRRDLERRHLELMSAELVNRKLAAHIGKYDGLFARLCIVWHCVEHVGATHLPRAISEGTARRIAEFLHGFLLRHAVAFYAGILGLSDDHDRLASVAGYILAHRLDVVTNRDVQRGDRTMRGLDRQSTQRVFEQLEALGWVSAQLARRAGDPPRWVVNPAVHARFSARAQQEHQRREAARQVVEGVFK